MCPPFRDVPIPCDSHAAVCAAVARPLLATRSALAKPFGAPLCLLLSAFLPATAFSQATSQPVADDDTLSEIIVTARKTEENVQDVPMSMQVLTAAWLDDADVTRLYELQFSVPGLVVNNVGFFGAGFALRGVADQGGTNLSVATHLNGVYLGSSNLAIGRMFDLERIEVLKGPQGTLYGRNATGGSINFITRAPTDEFGATLEASYGTFGTARVQGHVNMPVDEASFRIAFIGSESDGYIRNSLDGRKFGESDFWGLRASARVDVNEDIRIEFMAQRVEDDGASGELWTPHPQFLADPSDIRLTTVALADPFLRTRNDNVSGDVRYDLGYASLHSVTGYARSEVHGLDDCAGIPELEGCTRGVRPARYEQWSQEFRLASAGASTWDWLLGVYVSEADAVTDFHFTRPLLNPRPINNYSFRSLETAYAAFGQATVHVADRWSITGGLRLSAEEHRVSSIGTGVADHPALLSADNDWNHTSWRLDLEYAATDTVLAYAGVSTGFKSGGITTTILPNGDFNSFDAEDLIAYEAGLKVQWLDRRVTLNGAAFVYDFQNLQITSVYFSEPRVISEVENAARAELRGMDIAGSFQISERLAASAGFLWMPKREVVEFESERRTTSLSGNELSRAPEWTATATLDYQFPPVDEGRFTARLEYNYRTHFFFTIDNEPLHVQEDLGLLNLLLKFEAANANWYVFASGRNLTDQDYFNQVFLQSSPGYPDTYELGFGLHF
jgi:iron complex outermembrane recepter protein